jgi:hypothetical protein
METFLGRFVHGDNKFIRAMTGKNMQAGVALHHG